MNNRGFSLSEIIVTIIIIGVLSSIALPRLNKVPERFRAGEAFQVLPTLLSAQERYNLEIGSYATALGSLDVSVSPANFNAPTIDESGYPISMERSTGEYILSISSAGVISCDDSGGSGDVTCGNIGCAGGTCPQ